MKYYGNELYHHGILGQKWGIRRFQNKDGSLTSEGQKRYGVNSKEEWKTLKKQMKTSERSYRDKWHNNAKNKKELERLTEARDRKEALYNQHKEVNKWAVSNRQNDENGYSDLAKALYNAQVAPSERAYKKAQAALDAFEAKGEEYVQKKMKSQYGQPYDTWKEESKKQVEAGIALAVGGSLAAMMALEIGAIVSAGKGMEYVYKKDFGKDFWVY